MASQSLVFPHDDGGLRLHFWMEDNYSTLSSCCTTWGPWTKNPYRPYTQSNKASKASKIKVDHSSPVGGEKESSHIEPFRQVSRHLQCSCGLFRWDSNKIPRRNFRRERVRVRICSPILSIEPIESILLGLYTQSIAKPFLIRSRKNHLIFIGHSLDCQSFVGTYHLWEGSLSWAVEHHRNSNTRSSVPGPIHRRGKGICWH